VCVRVHMCIRVYVCVCTCQVRIYQDEYVHAYVCICVFYIRVYVYMHVYVCARYEEMGPTPPLADEYVYMCNRVTNE